MISRATTVSRAFPLCSALRKGQESDKFWGQQQGANGYVVKPFKAEDLVAAVKRALN